jgi:Zn-dependent protease
VAAAGPLSNLVIAGLAGLPIHAGILPWHTPFLVPTRISFWDGSDYLGLFLSSTVIFNCVLAVFNLIPVAPLDGFRVAVGILPRDLSEAVAGLEQYGIAILMLLLVLPMLTNGAVGIFPVISPAIDRLAGVFTGVNGNVFG